MWRLQIVKWALFNKWAHEYYERVQWFYRLKLALCILLNRDPPPAIDAYDLFTYHVTACCIDGGVSAGTDNSPTIYWSDVLIVGKGLLSNWWWSEYQYSSD